MGGPVLLQCSPGLQPIRGGKQLRRQVLPFGEAAGWLTDEDVFKAVS